MLNTANKQFYLRPFGQEDSEQDYQLLHKLSNFQVPQDPTGNQEWQHNRRHYDETTGLRRHYIAHEVVTREPVAYAAIERQWTNRSGFRLFLVFDPDRWEFSELGEFLYERLLEDAHDMAATSLTMVEYANDTAFLDFLRAHGFTEVGTTQFNGHDIVRMENALVG